MPIFPIISGIVLLVSGRRLFWLIIAILGFVFSYQLVQDHAPNLSQEAILIIGLLLGIIGAVLAVFIQKIAIALAGFFAGAMVADYLWQWLTLTGDLYILAIIVGGILGCLFMVVVFEWALVILTSLAGASLLVQGFGLTEQAMSGVVFLALTILGIFIQSWHSPPKRRGGD